MRPAATRRAASLRRSAAGSCAAPASLFRPIRFDASLHRRGTGLLLHNAFDSCSSPIYLCALCLLFLFLHLSALCVFPPVIRPVPSQPGVRSQFLRAIGLLPGESVDIAATEVSECGRLLIDRAAQVERFDHTFRRKLAVG